MVVARADAARVAVIPVVAADVAVVGDAAAADAALLAVDFFYLGVNQFD